MFVSESQGDRFHGGPRGRQPTPLTDNPWLTLVQCIDWAYWRRDEQGRGTWNLGFRWYIAFRSLPALFSHLASVSVNVSWACDWFAGKYDVAATHQYRNFIPQLFEACPVLHHLTLHAQPGDLPDPQSWRIRLTHVSEYLDLVHFIISRAVTCYMSCGTSYTSFGHTHLEVMLRVSTIA